MSLPEDTKLPRARANSRKAILDAALSLVAEAGAAHLTLEAVAQRAGISKGGLLYNFPSKLDLLQAMIETHVEEILSLSTAGPDAARDGASRALHKLLDSRLGIASREPPSKQSHAVLAAMVEHPQLLDPVRAMHHLLWERLKESRPDHDNVLFAWLAVEGLLCLELFKTTPLTPVERARIIRQATRLLDGELTLAEARRPHVQRLPRSIRKKREEIVVRSRP
jgi:AcrR family transcriptional regulator